MKIAPDAKNAWRWFSVQALTVIVALQLAWEALPADALAIIPADWRGYITLGLAVLAIIGRLIDQTKPEPTE